MQTNGEQFLQSKAHCNPGSFGQRFYTASNLLGIGSKLNQHDLLLLHDAAFQAALCNIAFNGLGGCNGQIKPQRENHRRNLETHFMNARNAFYASSGWKGLPASLRRDVERCFLTVRVTENNFAI